MSNAGTQAGQFYNLLANYYKEDGKPESVQSIMDLIDQISFTETLTEAEVLRRSKPSMILGAAMESTNSSYAVLREVSIRVSTRADLWAGHEEESEMDSAHYRTYGHQMTSLMEGRDPAQT